MRFPFHFPLSTFAPPGANELFRRSLGNMAQAFSFVSLISTCYNVDRATQSKNFPLVDA